MTVEALTSFDRRYDPATLDAHCIDPPAPATIAPVERLAYVGATRPGDDFNQRHSGAELLERLGFHSPRRKSNGEVDYVRPGKDARGGASATCYPDGHTTVWSETCRQQWPGLEIRRPYDPFGLYVLARHRGDWAAAAVELGAAGYGEPRAPDDLSWLADQPSVATDGTFVHTDQWGTNVPLSLPDVEPPDHGWHEADVGAILNADYEPPRPTVLRRDDGQALFYPQRLNALWGESGGGKSWLALWTCAEILNDGGNVLYIDLEDTSAAAIGRLGQLGVSAEDILSGFVHISPEAKWTPAAAAYVGALIADRDISLAIIDSTGEAMALDGAKPNDDDDTARWHRELPRFLVKAGCTVVLIDHVIKENPQKGAPSKLYAIGSQRKRAAISGAAYMVEAKVSPSKDQDGQLQLKCAKDRHGTYPKGSIVADIDVVNAPARGVQVVVKRYETIARPTVLMARISAYLSTVSEASTNMIIRNVSGKDVVKNRAIGVLVDEGFVEMEMRSGRGGGAYFKLLNPFTEGDGLEWSNQPQPPQPNLSPTSALEKGLTSATSAPSPLGGAARAEVKPPTPDPIAELF